MATSPWQDVRVERPDYGDGPMTEWPREISLILDGAPTGDWTQLYFEEVRQVFDGSGLAVDAGYVTCVAEDLETALDRLNRAVTETNTKFRASLNGNSEPDNTSTAVPEGHWDIAPVRGRIFRRQPSKARFAAANSSSERPPVS